MTPAVAIFLSTSALLAASDAPPSWNQPAANGDRIPDFSQSGYQHGITPPCVAEVISLTAQPTGDDGSRIQQALDQIANRPLDAKGFRGALLLHAGEFRVAGCLALRASGVVLRGEGKATILRATGNHPRSLISVGGGDWRMHGPERPVNASRVAVGSTLIPLASVDGLTVGQTIGVVRNGNAAWIHELGMDHIPPRHDGKKVANWSSFSLVMDRRIVALKNQAVVLDAPVVCAIDEQWGGGSLRAAIDTRIENIGIENLSATSDYDASIVANHGTHSYAADSQHADYLIEFAQVKNAWARNINTTYFAHGPVKISSGKWLSVLDCTAQQPVSKIDGGTRYAFFNNGGQLCLFRNCVADQSRHPFVYGSRVVGPNVFLRCRSTNDFASSEPHHRWSVGGLYDNCQTTLSIVNRGNLGSGHGWAGAHFVAWNCRGTIACESPPTAWNIVFGHIGKKSTGPFHSPDGSWISFGQPMTPVSLYEAQQGQSP